MAKIEITDESGESFTLDNLSDNQLCSLMNLSKLSQHLGINRYTFAARCCRSTSFYRSLVTALEMGKPSRD